MIPIEVSQLISKAGETVILEVEKGAIRKYADAVGDNNPLYWDEVYAREKGYTGLPAPLGFFGWPIRWTGAMPMASELRQHVTNIIGKAGYPRILDGGIEYECLLPIVAGDKLTAASRVMDIQETSSKTGMMLIVIFETIYTNQNGKAVARELKHTIYR